MKRSWILLWFLAVGLFFMEMRGEFRRGGLLRAERVGTVEESQGTVRRLLSGYFTWDRLHLGDGVSMGDTVATGEQARARLRLFTGGELVLDPGSMIVLRKDPSEMKLHVLVSSGVVRPSRGLEQKVKIVPTSKRALPTSPAQIAPVVDAQRIRNLGKELLMKGKLASLRLLIPSLELSFPQEGAIIRTAKSRATRFEWKLPTDVAPGLKKNLKFEFSLRSAQDPANAKTIEASSPSLLLGALSEGRYLWSVRAISPRGHRGPETVARSFEIRHLKEAVREPARQAPREPVLEKPRLLAPKKRSSE